MLKILKYEWKLGFRSVKTTLIAGFVISALFGLMIGLMGSPVIDQAAMMFGFWGDDQNDTVVLVGSIVWLAVWFALFVQTVDVILKALSSRMFAPEGYLAHTLPVEIWELLGGKALGMWLFGLFMTVMATLGFWVVLLMGLTVSGALGEFAKLFMSALPRLTGYHWTTLAQGTGWLLMALIIFMAASLIGIVNLQFICIAARQFGKHHLAGAVIVLVILLNIEGRLANAIHFGTLVSLIMAAACFGGSWWLLKNRLSV